MIVGENGQVTSGHSEEEIAERRKERISYLRQRSVDYALEHVKIAYGVNPCTIENVLDTAEKFYQFLIKE